MTAKLAAENPRRYGRAPYTVAVVHGGPGAAGEMAPVARELAAEWGVLEPLQTKTTLQGQVVELGEILRAQAALPVTLIGFSWGAWLSAFVAADYPELVGKMVMVGSGPFEARYAARIRETRLSRLSAAEREEFDAALGRLAEGTAEDCGDAYTRLGALAAVSDSYDPLPDEPLESGLAGGPGSDFLGVLDEAIVIRHRGELMVMMRKIRCPVIAIHGDYDPHPAEGVRVPLSAVLSDFQMITLAQCGHKPWMERQAKDAFYQALKDALQQDNQTGEMNDV